MGSLNLHYKDGGVAPDGVELLISILIRYPEVYSVSYKQPDHAISFRFTVSGFNQVDIFISKLREALSVYHRIESSPMRTCEVYFKQEGDVALVTITRDVESMDQKEVGLIVDLVRDTAQQLLYEDTDIPEDEQDFQEEVIGQILLSFRDRRLEKGFIAIREEGRVLVYKS